MQACSFQVEDHRYPLVELNELEPGETYDYGVRLTGGQLWPPAGSGFIPSAIRTATASA
ncbi:MAG: hypothetical protein ICV69_13710 [Thermoleophilaceae bacterium]|nr:hypothetical protein [Thermoleophilaceae bacterium]